MSSKHVNFTILTLLFLSGFTMPVPALAYSGSNEECMQALLQSGQDDMTLGELRSRCSQLDADGNAVALSAAESEAGSARRRLEAERQVAAKPFSILSHKPNYFLFAAYNAKGWDPTLYQEAGDDPNYQNKDVEGQFQISLKVPLALDLLGGRMDIYGAYTNRSFWQMYNSEYSELFRETNHEPEIWLQFRNDWQVFGIKNALNAFGVVHQSNGRAGVLSRSWNRVFANFVFEKENLVMSFKPWIWVDADKAQGDNPDITDYLGHGEFRAAWSRNDHVVSVMLRNQLESGFDRGALELGWSIPVFNYPYLKAYVQYFYGYGESLIDYDRKVNRIGLGISMTDWID